MLLGLKCNLEMTLARCVLNAFSMRSQCVLKNKGEKSRNTVLTHSFVLISRSRMSTAYHLGSLGTGKFLSLNNRVLTANLGVVQVQALVVSALSTVLTAIYTVFLERRIPLMGELYVWPSARARPPSARALPPSARARPPALHPPSTPANPPSTPSIPRSSPQRDHGCVQPRDGLDRGRHPRRPHRLDHVRLCAAAAQPRQRLWPARRTWGVPGHTFRPAHVSVQHAVCVRVCGGP